MATTLQEGSLESATISGLRIRALISERTSERLWALLCLVLFVILGPFSAPIALLAVFKIGFDERSEREPEPVCLD